MNDEKTVDHGPVLVIGCGAMGKAMAECLSRSGFAVFAHDTDPDRLELLEKNIVRLNSLDQIPESVRRFLLSLPGPEALSRVLDVRNGVPSRCPPNSIFVDTSTSEPRTTRRLAVALHAAGHAFVDAPLSGGRAGAEAGELTFYIGGEADDIDRLQDLLSVLGQSQIHLGPVGAGHMAKLANNFLCAGNLWLIREAAQISADQGITLEQLTKALNGGSGRSAASEVNIPRWVLTGDYDSGFTVGLMNKDLDLFAALAETQGGDFRLGRQLTNCWRDAASGVGATRDFNEVVRPRGECSVYGG